MPYIKLSKRHRLVELLENYTTAIGANDAGELNFTITLLLNKYFKENGGNYQAINDIVGALEGAKIEFCRRTVAPYEDKKILENGDVK
jgi:hypothetical protein